MIAINSIPRDCIKGTSLMEAILKLDLENMAPVFSLLGKSVPIERRKQAFDHAGTILYAEDAAGRLAGYLEYGPGWDNPEEVYLSSIQISPEHRNSILLLLLIRRFMKEDRLFHGQVIRTHVQKSNSGAMRIFKRFGFKIDELSEKDGTYSASMNLPPPSCGRRVLTLS